VVASRDQLLAALPDLQLPTTTLYLQAPESAAQALRATIDARVPGEVVSTDDRAAEAAALRSSPYVAAVAAGVALAALLAAGYAILAVMAGLALSGASRTLEIAHLRALGLPRGRTLALVLVEHGPIVAIAVAAGAALGAGLFVLLQPGLGLVAIVGSPVDVPLAVDLPVLGLVFVGIVMIIASGIALATTIERRVAPALALRKGFE
jgi:putative ABC transport system permease protein